MWEQCSVQLLGKTCLSAGKPEIFTADCEKEKPSYILNSSKAYIFQIKENLAKERKKYQNSRARYCHWLEYYVWFRWDDYYKQDMTTLINVTSESKIKILQRKLTHVEYRWVKFQAASLLRGNKVLRNRKVCNCLWKWNISCWKHIKVYISLKDITVQRMRKPLENRNHFCRRKKIEHSCAL